MDHCFVVNEREIADNFQIVYTTKTEKGMSASNVITSPSTPTSQSGLSKLSKTKRRKRKGSHNSNASIISIDHVSLKKLRKFQDKISKENKKQKQLYQEKKRKAYMKKYELVEKDEINKKSKAFTSPSYDSPQHSKSSLHPSDYSPQQQGQMEDITVEELMPLIRNLYVF